MTRAEKKANLLAELKDLAKEGNKRLRALNKAFPSETWAEKNLRARLGKADTFTATGMIRANKKMTTAQLRATIKATKNFLESKTSTVAGQKERTAGINQRLGMVESGLVTDEEADDIYQMFEDEEIANAMKHINGSDLIALVHEAKQQRFTEKGNITYMNKKEFASYFSSMYDRTKNKDYKKSLDAIYNYIKEHREY